MSRYVRLGYVLPRLVALVLLVAGLQVAAGWMARRAIVDAGQRSLGAKVEVDESSVSLLDTRVTLRGIRAADPREPMRNLVETDVVELDIDADGLLRRTLVVERGVVRGLRFGGDRETSGVLETSESDEAAGSAPSWLKKVAGTNAKPWLDDLEGRLSTGVSEELESVRLAEQIAARWPQRYAAMRREADDIRQRAESLERRLSEARQNPLRHASVFAELPTEAASLRERLAALNAELASLPGDVAADRERVAEAWRRDEQLVRDRLQTDQLDPDSLTSALLGERLTGSVRSLVDWLRFARRFAPATQATETTPAPRGVDVRFVGVTPRPRVLVRSLELRGMAALGGRAIEFTGLASDVTTDPALHREPTTIVLRSEGPTPLEACATLDRTGATAIDDLRIECPTLSLSGERLPLGGGVVLGVAPTAASLDLKLRLVGERVGGEAKIVHRRPRFTASVEEHATPLAERLAAALSSSLEGVDDVSTRVSLGGTLDRPRIGLKSDLGPAVAAAVQGAARQIAADQVERSLAQARGRLNAQLREVDGVLASATRELSAEMSGPAAVLQRLVAAPAGGRTPVGFRQLGERLSDSLTR